MRRALWRTSTCVALLLAAFAARAAGPITAKPLPPPSNCRTGTAASISSEPNTTRVPSVSVAAASANSGGLFYVRDATSNPLKNMQVEFTLPDAAPTATFGTGRAGSAFMPSATPHRVVVGTGDGCTGTMPLLVSSAQPGTFTMTARLVTDPSITVAIPVTIVAIATPSLFAGTGGAAIVAPGGALGGGVSASVSWSGGPLAGVPITFTAPASGSSAYFANGTNSITVATDAFGMAHADGTATTTPGPFTVQAATGAGEVAAGKFVIAGPATIRLEPPTGSSARFAYAGFNATLVLPWLPCGSASPQLDDMVSFTVDGAPIFIDGTSNDCTAGATILSPFAIAQGLLPGTHVLGVSFAGSTPVTQVFTLAPDFEGPSATGAGTLRLTLSDPNHGFDSGICATVAVAPGKLGDAGLPATAPPGYDLPYGLVRVDGTACGWGNDFSAPTSTPTQRVSLGTDRPLPPSTAAWEYGPTPDNAQPHWHVLPTALSGNYAVFEVAGERLPIPDAAYHTIVALGEPAAATVRNYQDLWWAGPAENGWGMSLTQHRDVLFGALFVYDAAGDPAWLVMPGGQWNADHSVYTGDLYRPHGSPYSAYNAAAFAIGGPVGRAALAFDSDATFTLAYTIDGIAGNKRLQRQLFGPVEPFAIAPLADLWWGGEAQNGWGFALAQQNRTLFGVLFTYDAKGNPVWFVAPSGTLNAQTYLATFYRTHGSPWLGTAYDPAQLSVTQVGDVVLTFQQPWSGGVLTFKIDGTQVREDVVRQPF